MRQFTYKLMIAFIFLTSFTTMASKNFEVHVESGQILNIKISNIQIASQLTFKDGRGEVLFKDKSLSQSYVRYLSLENLPLGEYSISLEDSNMISSKAIIKSKNGISVSDSGVIFKPHFKQLETDAHKIKVAFTNPSQNPTEFKVFDDYGNLVISLKSDDAVFSKTLDFSKVPSGEYSIAVNTKERSYYKNINIK